MTRSLTGPVRWYGGKASLVSWLNPLVPTGRVYVEPFGGAGSLLCSRPSVPVEVYNDLNGGLVNLMRCLQSPDTFSILAHKLSLTLYSREEYLRAIATLASNAADPIDRAWAFFVAHNMATNGSKPTPGRWARTTESTGWMAKTASRWQGRLDNLLAWHDRLRHVQIDQRDALAVIEQFDAADASMYLDPPYVASTRNSVGDYFHEADDAFHERLVARCLELSAAVVISGYRHPIYHALESAGWEICTKDRAASGGVGGGVRAIRTEVIWRNPPAVRGELTIEGE